MSPQDPNSMIIFDCNNDERLDLIRNPTGSDQAPRTGSSYLSINNGTGHYDTFEFSEDSWRGISWGDLDNDGLIDIVDVSFRELRIWMKSSSTMCLWKHPIILEANLEAVVIADVDGDGFLDIYSPDGNPSHPLWIKNLRNGSWSQENDMPGFPTDLRGNSEGSSACDINNDGVLDYFTSIGSVIDGFTSLYVSHQGNFGYQWSNAGDLGLPLLQTHEISNWIWGDCNNDGYSDVFISGDYGGLYIFDNTTQKFGKSSQFPNNIFTIGADWGDVDHDGDIDLILELDSSYSHPLTDRDVLFLNYENTCEFHEFSRAEIGLTYQGRNPMFADLDNDGDLDIVSSAGKIFYNLLDAPSTGIFVTPVGNLTTPYTPFGAVVTISPSQNESETQNRILSPTSNSVQRPWELHFGGISQRRRYNIQAKFHSSSGTRITIESNCLPRSCQISRGGKQHLVIKEGNSTLHYSHKCSGSPKLNIVNPIWNITAGQSGDLSHNITISHDTLLSNESLKVMVSVDCGSLSQTGSLWVTNMSEIGNLDNLTTYLSKMKYKSEVVNSTTNATILIVLDDSPLGQYGTITVKETILVTIFPRLKTSIGSLTSADSSSVRPTHSERQTTLQSNSHITSIESPSLTSNSADYSRNLSSQKGFGKIPFIAIILALAILLILLLIGGAFIFALHSKLRKPSQMPTQLAGEPQQLAEMTKSEEQYANFPPHSTAPGEQYGNFPSDTRV